MQSMPSAAINKPAAENSKESLAQSKVLIVDDIADNRLFLVVLLEELELEIFEAASGKEALELVENHQFSVILMDVNMPGLSGYDTASLIYKSDKIENVPIVMVTANDGKEDYLEAYEVGAVDYITKPVEPVVLISKVKQFVELNKQKRLAQEAHLELFKYHAQLNILLEAAGEGIIGVDENATITFANPKASELLCIDKERILGSCILDYVDINQFDLMSDFSIISAGDEGSQGQFNCIEYFIRQSKTEDNRDHWVNAEGKSFYPQISCEELSGQNGERVGAVIIFRDISDKKEMEQKLRFLASFDPLTKLANRSYFKDALDKAIARYQRNGVKLGLLFIDMDNFKYVNDNMGHDIGDLLLQIIAGKLTDNVREGDVVARMGGDEFAVIIYDVQKDSDIGSVALSILNTVAQPLNIKGNIIETSVSIGISVIDEKNCDSDELVKSADTAMYSAKRLGKNKFQYFKKEMQHKAEETTGIQVALQKAIIRDEFQLNFQPKIHHSGSKVPGCEALLRWLPQDRDSVSPGIFIPIAESSGQIIDIGNWVLNEVCQQIRLWQKEDKLKDLVVSANVSALQLVTDNFEKIVEEIIVKNSINPASLELELTETGVMREPEKAKKVLDYIHQMGVNVSIDDFGTGASSLDQLRRLPIDILKIDRSFVQGIGVSRKDEEIIHAMLAISDAMRIKVITEGVETKSQLDFMVSAGCELFQGYYYSKPLKLEVFEEFVNSYSHK